MEFSDNISKTMADLTETWSDHRADDLWLERFRSRCLHDIKEGIRLEAPVLLPSDERLIPHAIPRRIWMYWHQGWRDAPPLVQACQASWIRNNPDWEVISLDAQTENRHADIGSLISGKKISLTGRSNLIRLSVLASQGGVWVDATTYCCVPLSHWLPHLLQTGFFAFARPGLDRLLATWFIASEMRGYLVERWLALARRYWRLVDEADHYYWVHYLFAECLRSDPKARSLWATTPQVSADAPREVMRRAAETKDIEDILALATDHRVVVHKLDWRLAMPTGSECTPLSTLLCGQLGQKEARGGLHPPAASNHCPDPDAVEPPVAKPAATATDDGVSFRREIINPMLRMMMWRSAKLYSVEARQNIANRTKIIQAEGGARDAVNYLLHQLGAEMSVDHDEAYCVEALNFHLGLMEACWARPEAMSEHIKMSLTMPGPDDELMYSDHVATSRVTRQHQCHGIARRIPAILFACMPRSASATLTHSFAKLLDIPVVHTCLGLFPDYYLVPSWLDMFLEGGAITQDHFVLNDFNFGVLKSRNQRHIFVSVRDPRAAARSNVHWLLRGESNVQTSLEDNICRECIGKFIPWLQNWVERSHDKTLPLKIHMIRYEDIVHNLAQTIRHIARVLEDDYPAMAFYAKDPKVEEVRVHFDRGDDNAWRSEVSEATREMLWEACTVEIRELLRLAP